MAGETTITPVWLVEEIEPSLSFWIDRLGFDKAAEVPHGDRLGFVILARHGAQLMLQTRASVEEDLPGVARPASGDGAGLFVVVPDLDAVIEALRGIETLVGPRETFYGMREIVVRDPAGILVTFAQPTGTAS